MLYKHLGDMKDKNLIEDEFIQDEETLRRALYEQALYDLQCNDEFFFEKRSNYGILHLTQILNVFVIALYGTIDEVIFAFKEIWGDIIIKIEE